MPSSGFSGSNWLTGMVRQARGNAVADETLPPTTDSTGEREVRMRVTPPGMFCTRKSPGPTKVSTSTVARSGWLIALSAMLDARTQMLSCSASCCAGVDVRSGIVDQAMPVGAAVRIAGVMYGVPGPTIGTPLALSTGTIHPLALAAGAHPLVVDPVHVPSAHRGLAVRAPLHRVVPVRSATVAGLHRTAQRTGPATAAHLLARGGPARGLLGRGRLLGRRCRSGLLSGLHGGLVAEQSGQRGLVLVTHRPDLVQQARRGLRLSHAQRLGHGVTDGRRVAPGGGLAGLGVALQRLVGAPLVRSQVDLERVGGPAVPGHGQDEGLALGAVNGEPLALGEVPRLVRLAAPLRHGDGSHVARGVRGHEVSSEVAAPQRGHSVVQTFQRREGMQVVQTRACLVPTARCSSPRITPVLPYQDLLIARACSSDTSIFVPGLPVYFVPSARSRP